MAQVTSADGTTIAYRRDGRGPAVILVGGGLDDGSENEPLAAALAGRFTVVNYARRGRDGSGDTPPYAVAREVEDLEALAAVAGGPVHLVGVSSGGALALEAAAAGLAVDRLAVYEVPYAVGDQAQRRWLAYVGELEGLLAEGRRGDALACFMLMAGASEEDTAAARRSPVWPGLEAIAHTLAYDAACLGDGLPPSARLAAVTRPVLVASGGGDPHMAGLPGGFFGQAADAIAAALPHAQRLTIAGLGHVPDPQVLAPVLERFFD